MSIVEIRRIITEVTKDLTPARLDVDLQDDLINILVVSERFEGIPISKRFDLLSDAFEKQMPEFLDQYTLIYQAWTKAELLKKC